MGQYFSQIPDNLKGHVKELADMAGIDNNESILEKISQGWLEKHRLFSEQAKNLNMVEVEKMDKDNDKGVLALTYSGSLISLGCWVSGSRWAEYASIGLRHDVPGLAKSKETNIKTDISIGSTISFTSGPVKSTSQILKIAVCEDDIPIAEQEKRIREATIYLTNQFVEVNRSIINLKGDYPDTFTLKSIISYIAMHNDLTKKQTKQILDDYHDVLKAGVLKGCRVPVGKIGKLFARLRPAQKARVIKSPVTGEDLTIAAKPETIVPKISFSKLFKETSAKADLNK